MGFKEAKALLAKCTLTEELGIDFLPGGEWMEFVWVDEDGNQVAIGSWKAGGVYKVKVVGGREFIGDLAENLTHYYKTKQTRW